MTDESRPVEQASTNELPPVILYYQCPICKEFYREDEARAIACREQGYPETPFNVGDHFVAESSNGKSRDRHLWVQAISYLPNGHTPRYHCYEWYGDSDRIPKEKGPMHLFFADEIRQRLNKDGLKLLE